MQISFILYLWFYCMYLMQTMEFPHAQRSIVAKNFKAAFLFASANNNLSSVHTINERFFPQFKEIFKVTSHCFLARFLTVFKNSLY